MNMESAQVKDVNTNYPVMIETQDVLPEYERNKVGVIPREWVTKRLGEIGSFSKGRGIKRDDVLKSGHPCIRYGELYTRYHNYIKIPISHISPAVAETALPIKSGDLLFAGSGETAKEIGRCAVYLGDSQAFAGSDIIVLSPTNQNSMYLVHLMNHPLVVAQKTRFGQGDAVVHISVQNLAHVEVCLPPLVEQQFIAEALSDIDGLLGKLETLIAKKRNIKQATMQQLLTGNTRLPGFSERWKLTQLGEMGVCLRGVSYDPASDLSPCDTGSTVRLLRSNNILDSVINKHDVQFVESRRVSESQIMLLDDVLICMANGSKDLVGKTGLFREADGHTYTFGAFMGCFRTEQSISNPVFVYCLFNTYQFRNFVGVILAGSSINNLKSSDIESAEFRIPNLEEQNVIATILSDMDAEIAVQERRRDKIRAIKKGVMQQLLTGRIRLVKLK